MFQNKIQMERKDKEDFQLGKKDKNIIFCTTLLLFCFVLILCELIIPILQMFLQKELHSHKFIVKNAIFKKYQKLKIIGYPIITLL